MVSGGRARAQWPPVLLYLVIELRHPCLLQDKGGSVGWAPTVEVGDEHCGCGLPW